MHLRTLYRRYRSDSRSIGLYVLSLVILPTVPLSRSQTLRIQCHEKCDGDVPRPTVTGALGQTDAAAMEEVKHHHQASSSGEHPWHSLQGVGRFIYPAEGTQPSQITLTIVGNDFFRLDTSTSTGLISLRIHGEYGAIVDAKSKTHAIAFEQAAMGLVQFHRLRLGPFPSEGISLFDHGIARITGQALHRISLESRLKRVYRPGGRAPTNATDFYLDPTTHLVAKTATNITTGSGATGQNYLSVVSYSDYRAVDGNLLPFRMQETMNGQLEWTIQLDVVTLNPRVDPKLFTF